MILDTIGWVALALTPLAIGVCVWLAIDKIRE